MRPVERSDSPRSYQLNGRSVGPSIQRAGIIDVEAMSGTPRSLR